MPIDPGVFNQPAMREVLARRDIGRVYALLVDAGVSQREIACRTGQAQSEVHAILHGRPVKQYDVLERIAAGLGVDRGRLGLAYAGEQSAPAPPEEVDEDVKRRAFLAAASVAVWGRPVLGKLLELPQRPEEPITLPSRLGAADVDALEALTERLRALARHYGGQADTVGAVAARSLRLADVEAPEPLRARLYSALAQLHTLAGWCAFDSRADDQALRHFRRAVEFAGLGGDPHGRSTALRHAGAMLDQGGQHNDALKLYHMAQVSLADARGDERVPALGAWLRMVSARALAHLDRSDLARSELVAARDEWQPPDSFEQADMDHVTAKVQLRLGMLDSAEQFATKAARAWGGSSRRERVLSAITRTGIHLRAGQPSGPVLARQAIADVAELRSNRARDRLLPLADALDAWRQPELAQQARQVAMSRA